MSIPNKEFEVNHPISPADFWFIREVSDNEYDEIRASTQRLDKIHNEQDLLDSHKVNSEILNKYINKWKSENEDSKFVKRVTEQQRKQISNDVNRLLVNYLTSFRVYIDNSETCISRYYGKNSRIFDELKGTQRRLKDTFFSYRFFYTLRNYALHTQAPLQTILYNSTRSEKGGINSSVITSFNSEYLLSTGFDWKNVETDLRDIRGDFELIPLVNEADKCLVELHSYVTILVYGFLKESAVYLDSISSKHRVEGRKLIILRSSEPVDDKVVLTFDYIPENLIDTILKSKVN